MVAQTKFKQGMSNYNPIPEDPKYYIENSVMAKQPEVTLWDFISERPDKEYLQWAKEIGSERTRFSRLYDGESRYLSKKIL